MAVWWQAHTRTQTHTQPLTTFGGVSSSTVASFLLTSGVSKNKQSMKLEEMLSRSRITAAMSKRRCRVLAEIVSGLFIRAATLITRAASSALHIAAQCTFFFWASCLMRPVHVLEVHVALNRLELGVLLYFAKVPLKLQVPFRSPEFRAGTSRRECIPEYTGCVLYCDNETTGMMPSVHTLLE
jgi:hypothetical protein